MSMLRFPNDTLPTEYPLDQALAYYAKQTGIFLLVIVVALVLLAGFASILSAWGLVWTLAVSSCTGILIGITVTLYVRRTRRTAGNDNSLLDDDRAQLAVAINDRNVPLADVADWFAGQSRSLVGPADDLKRAIESLLQVDAKLASNPAASKHAKFGTSRAYKHRDSALEAGYPQGEPIYTDADVRYFLAKRELDWRQAKRQKEAEERQIYNRIELARRRNIVHWLRRWQVGRRRRGLRRAEMALQPMMSDHSNALTALDATIQAFQVAAAQWLALQSDELKIAWQARETARAELLRKQQVQAQSSVAVSMAEEQLETRQFEMLAQLSGELQPVWVQARQAASNARRSWEAASESTANAEWHAAEDLRQQAESAFAEAVMRWIARQTPQLEELYAWTEAAKAQAAQANEILRTSMRKPLSWQQRRRASAMLADAEEITEQFESMLHDAVEQWTEQWLEQQSAHWTAAAKAVERATSAEELADSEVAQAEAAWYEADRLWGRRAGEWLQQHFPGNKHATRS